MLYRYQSLNMLNLQSLIEDNLYFSNPSQFNDPLDCKPVIESDCNNEKLIEVLKELSTNYLKFKENIKYLEYQSTNPDYEDADKAFNWYLTRELQDELMSHYDKGVCCFSKSYNNSLLWSHYADQHKGICVGYSIDRDPKPQTHEVKYNNERMIKTSLIYDSFVKNNNKSKSLLEEKLLLTKTKHWKYEDEIRLIDNVGLNVSILKMEEIYFGLRCPQSLKYCTYTTLNNDQKKLKYFDITLDIKSSKIHKSPLNIDEMDRNYPHLAEEFDGIFTSLNEE